jgi:folate-binding protein YgfZ
VNYDDLPRRLLGAGPVVRRPAPYALIRVTGPDAVDFLQRMCTQDIAGMAAGEVRPAAFLDGKGRLLALCHAGRCGETVWLSAQTDTAGSLAEMLERYHFSEKLTVALLDLPCAEVLQIGAAVASQCVELPGGAIRLSMGRAGVRRERFHAPAAFFAERAWQPDDHAILEPDVAEALRLATAEPWVGVDSEPNTLALELPIDDHISLTKGCYTGQEIVARIHTYGHTNRRLCRLGITGTGAIEPGTLLVELDELEAGDPVGRVMSAADIPSADHRLALGFLPTALADPATTLALINRDGPEVTVLP